MELQTRQIDSLIPHPENEKWRKHPQSQVDDLASLLGEFGWLRNVVVSSDGYIVAGHGIVTAAKQRGETDVPVVVMPYPHDSPQAIKFMVAENTVQEGAEVDETGLAELLADIQRQSATGLIGVGVTDAGLESMIATLAAEDFRAQGKEFDENLDLTNIKTTTCPECGHEFPV